MRYHAARTLFALCVVVPLVGVALGYAARSQGSPAADEHTVFLAGQLTDEETLIFTSAFAASGHPGVALFEPAGTPKFAHAFLKQWEAKGLVAVGATTCDKDDLESRYGVPTSWRCASVDTLRKKLLPTSPRAVVAVASERRQVLHAACLAGVLNAPLLLLHGQAGETARVKQALLLGATREVYAIGGAANLLGKLGHVQVHKLADEEAVSAAYLKHQLKKGPVDTIVVANPDDVKLGRASMSSLAPWIALQKRAALVLTGSDGHDAEAVIHAALRHDALRKADSLLLVGNLQAIPMKKRPNPLEGGRDEEIEMEPMTVAGTGEGAKPCSFATGRLFHDDLAVVTLMLARQRLLAKVREPKVLMVSNPGGGLPLLETFSRNTANEFKNAGYDTKAYFGREANRDDVKRRLPDANIFLWEGHHSTLVSSYGIHQWQEPLQPSLVFLQSCLALAEPKAHPFLQRGAVGVIGSSTRTYSGSGGAFALAFFDTLLYEDQTLGGSLRQAKNFMLAFAELKKRRFGDDSKLGGANIRSAWAFTLWGDPTFKMPRPTPPENAVAAVRHVVKGNTILLTLPDDAHATIDTPKYQATVPANARLAGLVRKQEMGDQHTLVPFVFAEVSLPKAPPGKTPLLRTKLPRTHWAFCYDERCQRGYLLVTPRAKDSGELRFQIVWQ